MKYVTPWADEKLTERELEILQMVADGHSTISISKELWLSPETVKSYRKKLHRKLHARSGPHAVAIALRRGVIS